VKPGAAKVMSTKVFGTMNMTLRRIWLRTRKGIIESTPVIKAAWHLGFSGTVRAFISFRPLNLKKSRAP
jgi:hypothetical protein